LRPIALFAVGCVIFTTIAVAAAAHWLIGMPLPAAFVLGAIVAPPDVVAPLAIARSLGLPRRLIVILEGEGLANDATALILYRFAVVAVSTGHFSFGEASGMNSGLRSGLGTPVDSTDINIKTEPHDRGSILVAAVFDAYFTIYERRTYNLFRIFRAGGGTTENGDLPLPLAERLAAVASGTAEQFFAICARALDYCPPVDITFGDFLRAVLTADLDFHPDDPDGVRDAFMQAFRLRGIVADGAAAFSEDSLFWPKVKTKPKPLEVKGLVFGNPNGLTTSEKNTNGRVLRAFANKNAALLGFRPSRKPIEAPSFHPMFHTGQDGRLFVNMVVELVQTVDTPFGDTNPGTFPMRNGVTLLIAQDPPDGDVRPAPRVRFVIQKLWSQAREDRVRNYYLSTGRVPDDKRKGGSKKPDHSRFQINFGLLHAGV